MLRKQSIMRAELSFVCVCVCARDGEWEFIVVHGKNYSTTKPITYLQCTGTRRCPCRAVPSYRATNIIAAISLFCGLLFCQQPYCVAADAISFVYFRQYGNTRMRYASTSCVCTCDLSAIRCCRFFLFKLISVVVLWPETWLEIDSDSSLDAERTITITIASRWLWFSFLSFCELRSSQIYIYLFAVRQIA